MEPMTKNLALEKTTLHIDAKESKQVVIQFGKTETQGLHRDQYSGPCFLRGS